MKYNYDNILKIKSIKNLLKSNGKIKYPLNKPIIQYNYLFHLLININKIELLDNFDYPIYEFNYYNLDGIMLAANNQSEKTLLYLLQKFKDYIYNTNIEGNTWLHYLDFDIIKKIIFLKKLDFIDWEKLLYIKNDNNIQTISYILASDKFKFIYKILDKYFINQNNMSFLSSLFNNSNIKNNEMVKILKLLIKKKVNLNSRYELNRSLVWPLLLKNNNKILDLLYKYKKIENQGIYGFFPHSYGSHSLYFILIQKDYNEKLLNNYYKKFKEFLDLSYNNIYNDTIISSLLNYRIMNNRGSNYIEKDLFKLLPDEDFNNINIDNETLLHKLVLLNFQYSKYLKNKKLINIKNKDGLYPIDLATDQKWIKYLKKKKFIKKENLNINLINSKSVYATIFKAYAFDIGLYLHILENKYSELYIPKTSIKTLIKERYFDGNDYPDQIFPINADFAWIIIWNNKDSYYIHPYLNMIIMAAYNLKKYNYAALLISYRNKTGGLHAIPLIYDFKNKLIERWDSFGYNEIENNIDKILNIELTKDTIFKYKSLKRTQYIIGIQEMSLENEKNNIKRGDFGGFCAAWTIWFIEHKIKNPNIETKKLIKKLLQKIIVTSQTKYKNYGLIISHIRNYSNLLRDRIQLLFDKLKWDYDDYTNNLPSYIMNLKIQNYLIKNL